MTMGAQGRAFGSTGRRPCGVWTEQPSPRPGGIATSGPTRPGSPASAMGAPGRVAGRRRDTELPLCLPAAARVGSDGTGAVVRGSLVGKGRCKYDGEEVGGGEEEAPQNTRCAEGAHLGSTLVRSGVLFLSAVARATRLRGVRGGAAVFGAAHTRRSVSRRVNKVRSSNKRRPTMVSMCTFTCSGGSMRSCSIAAPIVWKATYASSSDRGS